MIQLVKYILEECYYLIRNKFLDRRILTKKMKKTAKAAPPSPQNYSSSVMLKNNQEVTLRLMLRRDVDGVWGNFNEVIEERVYLPAYTPVVDEWEKQSWYQDMISGKNFCVIAESLGSTTDSNSSHNVKNHVIGQCTIESVEWEAATHVGQLGIIVRSDYRNLGLGFRLIEFAKREAFQRGKKKLILSTFETNKMGLALYKKLGFRIVGTYKKQYNIDGGYVDEILMEYLYEEFIDV